MRQNQEVFATDHNQFQFQDRLSGIDGLSPEWGLQTQGVLSGGNRSDRIAGGNRGEIGRDPSVSTLRHARSGFPGHGTGATTLSRTSYKKLINFGNILQFSVF